MACFYFPTQKYMSPIPPPKAGILSIVLRVGDYFLLFALVTAAIAVGLRVFSPSEQLARFESRSSAPSSFLDR